MDIEKETVWTTMNMIGLSCVVLLIFVDGKTALDAHTHTQE